MLKPLGSLNISHNPSFSTRPLPCNANVLNALIHRITPRFVKTPLNVIVELATSMSKRPPARTSTWLPKPIEFPVPRNNPPSSTTTAPLNPALFTVNTALFNTTTSCDNTVPIWLRLVRTVYVPGTIS